MKNIFLKLITALLIIPFACNPKEEIAPINPCAGQKEGKAAFTIKEATYQDIIDPISTDFLMDTDSVYFSSVYFEALQQDADSFIWQIGTEPEPRYGKQVNIEFPDMLRGTTFKIRLIMKRKPNTRCFPNDDGVDTVTRNFYFMRFNEPLSWEGTYLGSDDDKPDSMFTIVLGHTYDATEKENFTKIFGIPRGCTDTINEFNNERNVHYKNIGFDRGSGINCTAKIVLGVFPNSNHYQIRYQYRTFVNGIFTKKNRVFTGIKIN